MGDFYTWDEFTNNGRFKQNCGGTNGAAKTYQKMVAEADIISMGTGNANFGVFLLGRLMNAIGFDGDSSEDAWIELERALAECEPEIKEQILALKDELDELLTAKLADLEASEETAALLEPMVNAITYTVVSYVLNYAGVLERIMELNPDAEVILVGIMNTMSGMDMSLTIEAYETNHTVDEAVKEKAQAVLEAAYALIQEYGDDALAYAYNYAEEQGYIAMAQAQLAELKVQLEALAAEVAAAGDALGAEVQAQIEALIAEANALIDQIDALIANGQALTEEVYQQVLDLLAELDETVDAILAQIADTGAELDAAIKAELVNLGNQVWEQLQTTKEEIKTMIPQVLAVAAEYLREKLGEAYDALVEALADLGAEYGPKAVQALYDYLLNNPEEVIHFVKEYGDDAVALIEKYQDQILAILMVVANAYGDDLVEYIKNNPEEVLRAIYALVEEYGDEAWALIEVYADALGITDALKEMVAELKAEYAELAEQYAELLEKLEEVLKELEQELAEIEEAIKAELEKLENAS